MKINKPLYYILNCTWGCIMTLIGAVVAIALLCVGKKPQKHAGCTYFNVGKSWGGMELGCFFLTDSHDSRHTKNHEFGLSLSWNFVKGKGKYSNKSINNSDSDTGVFEF